MSSSSEEDSFATPNPARKGGPGYKQPIPLSTHTNQMMNGWITTEKALPTPPTSGPSKMKQLHLTQPNGFGSSRRPGNGGSGARKDAATKTTEKGRGAWHLGRTGYDKQRDSPLMQRGKGKSVHVPDLVPRPNAGSTPVGATRQPITPPDEDELDGMFSLRAKDKGKGRAILSQMARPDLEEGDVGGAGFPETVADSQEEKEDAEEEDVFSLNRPRRKKRPTANKPIERSTTRQSDGTPDEMQESIMFVGHKNASASGSKSKPGPAPASRPARMSQGPPVQKKLFEFMTPRDQPKPKRGAGKKREAEEVALEPLSDDRIVSPEKKKRNRRRTIVEDRDGPRLVSLNVDTQDIVPDSQFDAALFSKVPVVGRDGSEGPFRDPKSDTGEDPDHPIEVFDESMVTLAKPVTLDVAEPVAERPAHNDTSSNSSVRAESDDELHSLAYREHLQLLASKRQINRSSGTAEDDESYRPAAFLGKPMMSRRVPISERLKVRSGLRAMMTHDDEEDEQESAGKADKARSTRSTRSKSRAKSVGLRPGAASAAEAATEDPDTDIERPDRNVGKSLADAARAATEKVRLGRTTSGGSSHTSATQGLEGSSELTPLPSEYEEEGPDVLDVELPDELAHSVAEEEVRPVAEDNEDDITPRRPSRRMARVESRDEPELRSTPVVRRSDSGTQQASAAELFPTVDDLEMAFGSAPLRADETMPATFDIDMDEDVFAQPIPADLGGSTIPQSWADEMEPSLLGQQEGFERVEPEIEELQDEGVASGEPIRESRAVTPAPPEVQLGILVTPPRQPSARMVREDTPQTPPRPAVKAVQALRTPHREPLRDMGFTVPILGQPRTPIGPSSTRKFITRSPQSPVTPSKLTPARASLQSPRAVVRSPVGRSDEWVDNAETLATWSPAKFESLYSMAQPLGGGTSLRQAFEETLRKDASAPPQPKSTMQARSSSPRNPPSDVPVLGNEPSSDSATGSAGAEARNSLHSETSAGRKRKLAGSEDGTIPGTFQQSGPSFHLLQSAPHAESAKKRVKLSEQSADGRKRDIPVDPNVTPKAASHAAHAARQTPVLDPQNPMTVEEDATPRNKGRRATPQPFASVTSAWSGVQQDQDAESSGGTRKSSKTAKGKKHDDGKEQTSLHAFGYSKQRKKRDPERALLEFDRDFEDEEDLDPGMVDITDGGTHAEGNKEAEASNLTADSRMSHVPLPPIDPRLRGQGRKMARKQWEREEEAARDERARQQTLTEHRPGPEPIQAEPRSDPHEARIYSMEDLEAADGDGEVVPSSQYGERLTPLRSLSSSGRRSVDDGSSFRTMEPPGEETQMWWKAMNDISRD